MKIRHPWFISALAFLGALAIRLWMGTVRYRYGPIGPDVEPRPRKDGVGYIYAFWHENMLLLAYHYARPEIRVLISQHADGQLIAEVCRHLGFGVIRGSTTRGGVEGMRQMLRAGKTGHVAITPDGPRGPRRVVQPGLIFLAAKTGMPIVPIGIGYDRPWRLKSWDRFGIPRPWTRGTCVTGLPIVVPADLPRDQLEHYRQLVESAMHSASTVAEKHAHEAGG